MSAYSQIYSEHPQALLSAVSSSNTYVFFFVFFCLSPTKLGHDFWKDIFTFGFSSIFKGGQVDVSKKMSNSTKLIS